MEGGAPESSSETIRLLGARTTSEKYEEHLNHVELTFFLSRFLYEQKYFKEHYEEYTKKNIK